jgi:plastocyanin
MTSTLNTTSPPAAGRRAWRQSLAVAATASAVLVAAGCGSDDRQRPADSEPPAVLRVTETDFAIKPAKARVERPGAVHISVANRGEAPHSLAIETPDGVVQTDPLQAGESGDVQADLEAGTYTWFCPVGDHRARGMEGQVTVGSGGGDSGEPPGDRPRGSYGY